MTEDQKKELLIRCYEDAYDCYGAGISEVAAEYWHNELEDSDWPSFKNFDKKLKIKFYYEGED